MWQKVIFYLCDLGVHGAVHVVKQVESLRNQLIPILDIIYIGTLQDHRNFENNECQVDLNLEETLLDLGLSSCVEVVGISCPEYNC